MDNQNFNDNTFIIDLSNAKNTLQVINELSNILEMSQSKEKNICLKVREIELSQAQLLSIKSLIQASGANLAVIDTDSERTTNIAQDLGISVSKINKNLEIEQNENFVDEPLQEIKTEQEDSNDSNNQDLTQNVKLPDFMDFEDIHKEELDKIINKENENSEAYSDYMPIQQESELSYEIFKTEEIEEQKNEELPTLYLRQTLRSGQTLCYDGNILIIGDTHPGSELIAKGDITVWGVLGGIAHAGTSGDKNARIRALKLNAIQLRIAGIYAGRTNTENIPFIQRSTEFTPQEARIENDTIVIRSIEI